MVRGLSVDAFISENLSADISGLALQRDRYPSLSDADFRFALQQIEGRQVCSHKLPVLSHIDGWWFARRLSLEQCSSEQTAAHKATLVSGNMLVDLTGGYGVDCFFLSERFSRAVYVERSEELCRIARHNFAVADKAIEVVNNEAKSFLHDFDQVADCIYIDPARRNRAGQKVFRLQDCEPDVLELMPMLKERCRQVLLKLSPMIDIKHLLSVLPSVRQLEVVAVRNEVKEVLCLLDMSGENVADAVDVPIRAVNLGSGQTDFDFSFKAESEAVCQYADSVDNYVYEPNSSIMKGGAFKLIASRYGLKKLAVNSHLYTSDLFIVDFPGRVWQVVEVADKKLLRHQQYNIISRNYPLNAVALQRKYQIKDGGNSFLIATRVQEHPVLFVAIDANDAH